LMRNAQQYMKMWNEQYENAEYVFNLAKKLSFKQ
jgi:hypothetical protein